MGEVSDTVKLILDRWEKFPDEYRENRWGRLLTAYDAALTPADKEALAEFRRNDLAKKFHAEFMRQLLSEPEVDTRPHISGTTTHHGYSSVNIVGHGSGGTIGGTNSSSVSYDPRSDTYKVGGTTYTRSQLDAMGVLKIFENNVRAQQTASNSGSGFMGQLKNYMGGRK